VAKKNIRDIKYLNSRKSKEDLVPYNYKAFEKNIKKELIDINSYTHINNSSPLQSTIVIQDLSLTLISRWIKSKAYKDLLLEAVLENQEKDNKNVKATYEFYTDGSLKDRGSLKSAMESSWIQTLGPNPNTIFKIGSSSWPSSSKAEALAIFTALLTVPEKRKVKIVTDSQTCIDTFRKLSIPHPKFTKKKLLKVNNWSIWTKVLEMVQSKVLTIDLVKIKAHSGNLSNEYADQLAKEAFDIPSVEIDHQETGPILSPPSWNNIPIDISTREFTKEIHKKLINFNWISQNRNQELFLQETVNENQYEWDFLWKKQNRKKQFTSIESSKKKAF
jgi:ribonuclease HI